jgi:DNA-binding NtrC family response regulator
MFPLLAEHFAPRYARAGRAPATFDHRALQRLRLHYWPGNVRELRNVVECWVVPSETNTVQAEDVGDVLSRSKAPFSPMVLH